MTLSDADRTRMGTRHPDLVAAIKRRPFPDLTDGKPNATLIDVRHNRAEHLKRLRHLYPIPGPIPEQVTETEHQVPLRDGSSIRVKTYIPTDTDAKLEGRPLVVMFHEGGWSFGDLTDEDLNCRMFARELGAVCVNVAYRLAPEHPFPTGVNDAWDAVLWCAKTAAPTSSILPADPRKGFIVGGASAGGNLSAVMCQIARDQKLSPPLTGQFLCVPALLDRSAVPEKWKAEYRSRTESDADPVLQTKSSDARSDVIIALKPETSSPLFSPLLHKNLRNLPPAYFQVAGLDPLRDEGLLYERVLREENGVPTRLNLYEGFGHMFWTNWPELEQSSRCVEDACSGVKWLIEQSN